MWYLSLWACNWLVIPDLNWCFGSKFCPVALPEGACKPGRQRAVCPGSLKRSWPDSPYSADTFSYEHIYIDVRRIEAWLRNHLCFLCGFLLEKEVLDVTPRFSDELLNLSKAGCSVWRWQYCSCRGPLLWELCCWILRVRFRSCFTANSFGTIR